MTVKELIEQLQKEDPNRLVVISVDEEGNYFAPVEEITTAAYDAEDEYGGNVGLEKLTPELIAEGYSDADVVDDGVPALVLWPTN